MVLLISRSFLCVVGDEILHLFSFHLLIWSLSATQNTSGGHVQVSSTFLFQVAWSRGKASCRKRWVCAKVYLWTNFHSILHIPTQNNRKSASWSVPWPRLRKSTGKRKTEIVACWYQSYITTECINFLKMPHHRGVIRCGAVPVSSPLAFEVFCLECQ